MTVTEPQQLSPPTGEPTRRHVRGSALLLVGRFISLGLNLAGQVLVVRHLSKEDYGALAVGLTVVALGPALSVFGFPRTIARFVPIYREAGDRSRLLGSIVLSLGTILGLGAALVLLAFGLQGALGQTLSSGPRTAGLLLILIALTPLGALDVLMEQLLAVFAGARSIFLRRHVLAPGLRLAAIVVVIALHGSATFLAYAYVVGGTLTTAIYSAVLVHILRKQGLFRDLRDGIRIPAREILGFGLPLLSSDGLILVRTLLVVALVELFRSAEAVAEYRAVIPLARLNTLVLANFTFLFIPAAARLFARSDHTGVESLAWRSGSWIAVLTFPILAMTFCVAEPLTTLVLGERYASSGAILSWLALGNYVYAIFGIDVETLKVYGRIRSIVLSDVVASVLAVALCVTLIPRQGALGAAIAMACTLMTHRVMTRIMLRRTTHFGLFHGGELGIFAMIALGVAALGLLQLLPGGHLAVGVTGAVIYSLVLLRVFRATLRIEETFPEILRVPGLGSLLRSSARD